MITLSELAQIAGVTPATVSRALNGSAEISESRKLQIRKLAEEYNYTPNLSARALVGKSIKTVGIMLPEINSTFYSRIANCFESELKQHDYSMIVAITEFDTENEKKYLKILASHKVDGIIFVDCTSPVIKPQVDQIAENLKIPIIFYSSGHPPKGYDKFIVSENTIVKNAVRALHERGCTRIGFLSDKLSGLLRYPAFKQALKVYGLPFDQSIVRVGPERFEKGGYLRMKEILASKSRIDGIFIAYDEMAFGAFKAIKEAGLQVPADLKLVSSDNLSIDDYLSVPLASFNIPHEEMAHAAICRLFDRIKNKGIQDSVSMLFTPSFFPRASIGN